MTRHCRNNQGAEDYTQVFFFFRLEGLGFKVQNPVMFFEIALAVIPLPSCILLAEDMRTIRMCHRPGDGAPYL